MWSAGTNWVVFPGTFQGASIRGKPTVLPSSSAQPQRSVGDTQTRDWLNQINTFYSAATATMLQEMATTPDIDGNMLLDNTVVVYLSEVARAWDHNQQNMPLIVFGGKNTHVQGGKYLKITGGRCRRRRGSGNRPFNDFWLSLLPVFGVDGSVLSKASGALQSTGPISGIFS